MIQLSLDNNGNAGQRGLDHSDRHSLSSTIHSPVKSMVSNPRNCLQRRLRKRKRVGVRPETENQSRILE